MRRRRNIDRLHLRSDHSRENPSQPSSSRGRKPYLRSHPVSSASSPIIRPDSALPLSPGTRLGPYEVAVQIGAGGMGEVYRARDTKLGRDVAIKVLPES